MKQKAKLQKNDENLAEAHQLICEMVNSKDIAAYLKRADDLNMLKPPATAEEVPAWSNRHLSKLGYSRLYAAARSRARTKGFSRVEVRKKDKERLEQYCHDKEITRADALGSAIDILLSTKQAS